jgi:phage repressor protein C with HTH and peptisase S24 domain
MTAQEPAYKPVVITVDEHGNDNIVMVDVKAAAGYPTSYLEPTYMKQLPAFKLPGVAYKNGIFRAFQVDGDSMFDTLDHGDWVICRFLEHFSDIRDGYVHVVVTKEEICVKRLLNRTGERQKLVLLSDNEDYPTREIDAGDISEIWLVKAKIGYQLRSRRRDLFRIINDLQSGMVEIKGRIQKLEDNKPSSGT